MSLEAHRDLHVLRRVTESLSAGHPLPDALRVITDAALHLLPCDHASIRLLDPSRTTLAPVARSGRGSEARALPLAKGQGIAGWVAEQGLAANVRDARSDPRFVVAVGQGFSVRSIVAEPLFAGGRPAGVLSASSSETAAFKDDHAVLARILAGCAAAAVERARLEGLSALDDVSHAYSVRYLTRRLDQEMQRARHSGSALSLLAIDLDRFRHVNESYGREVGDRVLAILSERVHGKTRKYDVLVRSGDDEFVLILPATSPIQASASGEKLRAAIGGEPMEPWPGGFFTQRVSIGVATWDGTEAMDDLLHRGRAALRAAKAAGGDAVSTANGGPA